MTNGSLVVVDLVVITSLVRLVTEKVDLGESFVFNMLQAVGLVPSGWENIKRNLTSNGISQSQVREFFLQRVDHGGTNVVDLVVRLEIVLSWVDAFLPTGETLIIPFLNSMKVPLLTGRSIST